MKLFSGVLLLFFSLQISGCAAKGRMLPMSATDCQASKICLLEGRIEIVEVDHVYMGKFAPPEGGCINVSLPKNEVEKIKKAGPTQYKLFGRVFPSPSQAEDYQYKINGRRVGLGQCGNFYVLVE